MWTSPTALIRAFVSKLPDHAMFTTRQLLGRGKRAATDQALYRLVRAGKIRRLARGVFVRDPRGTTKYDDDKIARMKSESFRREITEHPETTWKVIADGIRVPPAKIYSITGRSSSFKVGETTILLKENCARKSALAEDKMGRRIRALWSLGRQNFDERALGRALRFCNGGVGRTWLKKNYGLLPWWLMDRFMDLPGFRIAPADLFSWARAST